MDFKRAVVKAKHKDTEYKTVRVKYDTEFYCIINSIRYPIILPTHFTVLYSLPINNKHKHWTKKVLDKPTTLDIVYVYWSPIKPNMIVKGKLYNDKFQLK